MASSVLSQASRFNSGSDLWIVPPLLESSQTLLIDWYLNFQISQFQRRPSLQSSAELKTLLEKIEWSLLDTIDFSSESLMISAVHHLPCRWVVVIDGSDDLKSWTQNMLKVWTRLQEPSLRIFLPPQATTREWISHWRGMSSYEEMTLVLDG